MKNLKTKVKEFMSKNPNQNQIENFYINNVLQYTSDSIQEILNS